jgi:predicted PurR-regulated permease PerM
MVAVVIFLIGLAAYFLSRGVYRRLVRAGNVNAVNYRWITFILSFLLIFLGIAALVIYGVRIER